VPTIVPRSRLIEGNTALQAGQSAASLAGEGLGGFLVQTLTAPFAIIIDAATFVYSAVSLIFIQADESPPLPRQQTNGIWSEMSEGLRFIFHDQILAPLTIGTAIASFSLAIYQTVIILYLTRSLAIEPSWLGLILTCRSIGALSSTLLSNPLTGRLGPGPALIAALALETAAMGLIPLIGGSMLVIVSTACLSQFVFGLGSNLYSITQISLRQSMTPDRLLGRVNASRRVLVFGVMPTGGLIGGWLGETIGWRGTLLVGSAVLLASTLFHLQSPLRRMTSH
jgi:predicted MFS family arabinose efflux permease